MNEELKTYLEEKFGSIDQRIASVDERMATTTDLASIKASITDLGESISALATHMDERFDEIQPILNKVDNHDKRIQYLEDRLPKLATS